MKTRDHVLMPAAVVAMALCIVSWRVGVEAQEDVHGARIPGLLAQADMPTGQVKGKATTDSLQKVIIAAATPAPVLLPIFYAKEKGIFKKYGIDATIVIITGGSVPLAALLTDEVQILSISGEGVAANLAGAEVVYILSTLPAPAFSIYAKPEVREISQLAGKKVGVSSRNSSSENIVLFSLKKAGIPREKVNIIYTGGTANSLAALTSGSVDAAVFSSPNTLFARKQGFRELINGAASGWVYLGSSSLVKKSYAQKHPDLILGYAKGVIEAIARIQKDREGAQEVIGKYNKIKDKAILDETYEAYAPHYLKVPLPPVEGIRAALDSLALKNPAAARADPSRFVEDKFVKELDAQGFIRSVYGN